jgi:uncharacterized protein YfaP (DUF2135 family)
MVLKITLVLVSGRRIQARCKDLIKVKVKLIRKGRGCGEEREKHFLVPMKEMGTKTQNGGP